MDYLQPGGIYRDVTLRIVPEVFIADVFAKPDDVLSGSPSVEVEVTIDAAVGAERPGADHGRAAGRSGSLASAATR